MSEKTLRLILGDQLNASHSWFKQKDNNVTYLIAELHQETSYVKHHIQKVCAFFSAMENFSKALKKSGHKVIYLTLDDTKLFKTLPKLIESLCTKYSINRFEYQQPDEYRLLSQLQDIQLKNIKIKQCDSEHFLLPFNEIDKHVNKDQRHTMEAFYRQMRKRFDILIKNRKPEGGKWNYDSENRKKLSKDDISKIPDPLIFSTDVSHIIQRIKKHKIQTFGKETKNLIWPCTRQQSLKLLNYFCTHLLKLFGKFQDAMTQNSDHQWSLYHSRLSFAINAKILHPKIVIDAALKEYQNNSEVELAQVEGFVRQILGWREFIRAIYWVNMPQYANKNHFQAINNLPDYFWTGDTKMSCVHHAVKQSLEYAYAHHIQRLMVTGNFCLLAGIDPNQVDDWYLGIYIDAIEWVEMPNTRGMTQYADGGIVATKPYSASGNYINKMSDYCKSCHYQVKEKVSEEACPLNSMYWHFMNRHRQELEKNPRIGMTYRSWDKMKDEDKNAILVKGNWCLDNLEDL